MAGKIFMRIIAFFMVIGGMDRITGDHLGLGREFEKGFRMLGELALCMTGILCLTPAAVELMKPWIVRTGSYLDPSFFSVFLSADMGGFTLAQGIASTKEAGVLNGLVTASMLGCTLVYIIPAGYGIIREEEKAPFSQGMLIGTLTIPAGTLAAGIVMGIPAVQLLKNVLPVFCIAVLIAAGLARIPERMIRGCIIFGKLITALATAGLIPAAFTYLTGYNIIPGMLPITEAMEIVCGCGIILLGAYPFLKVLTRILKRILHRLAVRLRVDDTSMDCLVFALANAVPVFAEMKKMDRKGIVLNGAWMVPVSAVFGDFLAYAVNVAPDCLAAMIVGKLTAGLLALFAAGLIMRKE